MASQDKRFFGGLRNVKGRGRMNTKLRTYRRAVKGLKRPFRRGT